MDRTRVAALLRELADEIERDEEFMPYVCPECHCVGDEPHAPGCFEGEEDEKRRDDFSRDDEEEGDSGDHDDEIWTEPIW